MIIKQTSPHKILALLEQNDTRQSFEPLFHEMEKASTLERIELDLKDIDYVNSDILTQFMSIKKYTLRYDAQAVLLNVGEGVYNILHVVNMLPFFVLQQDFSSYSVDELIECFYIHDLAEGASIYMAHNYNNEIKNRLYQIMDSGDPVLKENAILTIGRAYDTTALPLLRKELDNDYVPVQQASILVLGWFGDIESKEKFYEYVFSDNSTIVEAAAASIALVSDKAEPDRLKMLSESPNPGQRSSIAIALSLINGDDAYTIIKDMLDSEKDPEVLYALVNRISFFNKEDATKILIGFLDHPLRRIQEIAASGLERTGLKGYESIIISKISAHDNWVSYFAVKALGKKFSMKTAEFLIDIYKTCTPNVKLAILQVIGYASIDIQSFIKECLKDNNEDIRKEALQALTYALPDCAGEFALNMAKHDESWLVRYKAIDIIDLVKPEGYKDALRTLANYEQNKHVQNKIKTVLDAA